MKVFDSLVAVGLRNILEVDSSKAGLNTLDELDDSIGVVLTLGVPGVNAESNGIKAT